MTDQASSGISAIKKEFFAYRNGIVADTLRKAGDPHKVIFGLNVPQIAQIARPRGYDQALAISLWNDVGCRESRLLATYFFDPAATSHTQALDLMSEIISREEADMLAFRLLKRLDNALSLLAEAETREIDPYMIDILRRHLE